LDISIEFFGIELRLSNLDKVFSRERLISYAQNFEDVMLFRALNEIQNGFYVDVGAGDPMNASVTRLFYEQGWSGINIEPHPVPFQALEHQRGRDLNLQMLASNFCGTENFYLLDNMDYSTANLEVAVKHQESGQKYSISEVQTITLNEIFSNHLQNRDVHFLKVDVEGSEKEVIEGINLVDFRPWILVVEATYPNSQKDNYGQWEFLVLQQEYDLVYKDGLNRFYLANEHVRLKPHFQYPPNVFDNFEQYYGYRQAELDRLRLENAVLENQLKKEQSENAPESAS
jgi:FkbM family methyltransferase